MSWFRFISSFLPPLISHTLTRFVSHPVPHTLHTIGLSLPVALTFTLPFSPSYTFVSYIVFANVKTFAHSSFALTLFPLFLFYNSVLFLSLSVLSQSLLSLIFFSFSLSPSFLSSSVVAFISHFPDSLTQSFALNLTRSSYLFSRTDRNDPHIDFLHVCFKRTSFNSSLHFKSFYHTYDDIPSLLHNP